MSLHKELLELFVALSPLLIALIVAVSTPQEISRWVGAVLATAILAVGATGFSMMRFVGACAGQAPVCGPDYTLVPWQPGLIQSASSTSCFRCAPLPSDLVATLAMSLNTWTPQVSLVAAALCSVLSALMLVRFARWSRIDYRGSGR